MKIPSISSDYFVFLIRSSPAVFQLSYIQVVDCNAVMEEMVEVVW